MKNQLLFLTFLFGNFINTTPIVSGQNTHFQTEVFSTSLEENEAYAAFQYFLHEVEQDALLKHEEQHNKIQEFKNFAADLSPEVASHLTSLLLQETRSRILDILQNANLNSLEIDAYLADYEKAILKVSNMSVEIARQMLFFVAELKIHRQYVHDFGVALGCPKKQLLRHDLCKLSVHQFEGYARYYRGGRLAEDRPACLAAWELHQCAEHHLESYSKKGFDFDHFPEECLRNNMLEATADWLAASKQRGGCTVIDYLLTAFPQKNYDLRLLPYLEEALIKGQVLYLKSEADPASNSLFKGFPCWNSEVEMMFRNLQMK